MNDTAVLTRAQAAKRIGRSERTIREWIRQGQLVEIGGLIHKRNLLDVEARMNGRQLAALKQYRSANVLLD